MADRELRQIRSRLEVALQLIELFKMVAQELGATGTVRRARAQELLDRWMPVQGGSLFEAFAGLLNARVEVRDLAVAASWLPPPA